MDLLSGAFAAGVVRVEGGRGGGRPPVRLPALPCAVLLNIRPHEREHHYSGSAIFCSHHKSRAGTRAWKAERLSTRGRSDKERSCQLVLHKRQGAFPIGAEGGVHDFRL
jgi:hypothetical protein